MTSSSVEELLASVYMTLEPTDYVVMRNASKGANELGDVDLLVKPADLARTAAAVRKCAVQSGWNVFYEHRRPYLQYFGLNARRYPERFALVIEIFGSATWYGMPFLDASRVVADRRRVGATYVPAPSHEAAMTLCHHLLWNARVPEKYRASVHQTVSADPREFGDLLRRSFGSAAAQRIALAAAEERWSEIEAMAGEMRRRLALRHGYRLFQPGYLLRGSASTLAKKPGLYAVIIAPQQGPEIVSTMAQLADRWHLFLPVGRHFRFACSTEVLQPTPAEQRAIKRGGVVAVVTSAKPARLPDSAISLDVNELAIPQPQPDEMARAVWTALLERYAPWKH